MAQDAPRVLRAAIYTRKSHEDGLEQAYNSLHAQRDACEAYIRSQAGLGWTLVETAYDDGGCSGGNLERDGLQRLLADVQAGRVDIIAIYKLDRLTRSLTDFARIVEVLDKAGASFVAVTQPINTTTSMGRLMLNVLLSFAQFEREQTGERIRDKIAASKAKGLWMGGPLALGYDPGGDNTLVVNAAEAATVRHIFERYLKLKSVHRLVEELDLQGIRSKAWVSTRGRAMGGAKIGRGALYHLLRNVLYRGLIRHKDKTFPGHHPAIIEAEVFDAVQARLDANQVRKRRSASKPAKAVLTGKIIGADGEPMTPTFATGRRGRIYRYFVSGKLQRGERPGQVPQGLRRIPAEALEAAVLGWLRRLTDRPEGSWETLGPVLRRVEVRAEQTQLVLDAEAVFGCDHPDLAFEDLQGRLGEGERALRDGEDIRVVLPVRMQLRGGRTWVSGGGAPLGVNAALVRALRSAHDHLYEMGAPAWARPPSWAAARPHKSPYVMALFRLALLAPDIQQAILAGRQPQGVTVKGLLEADIPLGWPEQRAWWASLGRVGDAQRSPVAPNGEH